MLKYVPHSKWGTENYHHRETILNCTRRWFCQSCCMHVKHMDQQQKSNLKKLEPVHNTALRIATETFRTSPISSLLVEAGLPSLNQLIKEKNMKYMVKLKKLPYSLIDCEILSADDVPILNKPEESLCDLELETQKIITQNLQIIPPWQENPIEICEEMKLKRHQMMPQEMRNYFLQRLKEHH